MMEAKLFPPSKSQDTQQDLLIPTPTYVPFPGSVIPHSSAPAQLVKE